MSDGCTDAWRDSERLKIQRRPVRYLHGFRIEKRCAGDTFWHVYFDKFQSRYTEKKFKGELGILRKQSNGTWDFIIKLRFIKELSFKDSLYCMKEMLSVVSHLEMKNF